jgi:hypothetical protein
MAARKITHESLLELISYDADVGHFEWRERPRKYFKTDEAWQRWNRDNAWTYAGVKVWSQYIFIWIKGQEYSAHRLAWLYVHGAWPKHHIDHINQNPSDNRIENLRDISPAENARNARGCAHTKSGIPGVSRRSSGKFYVSLTKDGVRHSVGTFKTPDEAIAARKKAMEELGFSPLHGTSRRKHPKSEAENT